MLKQLLNVTCALGEKQDKLVVKYLGWNTCDRAPGRQ